MNHQTDDPVVHLPDTPEGCRVRLAELHDEVRSIRIEISTRDLRRQAERHSVDPDWYHRASTAVRHKRREIALVQQQLDRLVGPARRDSLKDALISVLRAEFDDAAWSRALARARQMLETGMEVRHG
jgi:hypothetical protein